MSLYGDSHGRHRFSMINDNSGTNVKNQTKVKPGAKFVNVTEGCIKQCSDFNVNDFVMIVSGSNNVYYNFNLQFLNSLNHKISQL